LHNFLAVCAKNATNTSISVPFCVKSEHVGGAPQADISELRFGTSCDVGDQHNRWGPVSHILKNGRNGLTHPTLFTSPSDIRTLQIASASRSKP